MTTTDEQTKVAIEDTRIQELLKAGLLKRYAEPHRTPHDFLQLDGFYFDDGLGDDIFRLDSDNDCIFAGRTTEIRASGPDLAVRVLIHDGTPPATAVRLLRKLADWYERQPEIGQRGEGKGHPSLLKTEMLEYLSLRFGNSVVHDVFGEDVPF